VWVTRVWEEATLSTNTGGPVHNHIVNKCPLTKKSEGGLQLHEAKNDAVKWLQHTRNVMKWGPEALLLLNF